MMEFSYSKHNPKIKLSPQEILDISLEINQVFAPILSVKTPSTAYSNSLSAQEMLDISEDINIDFAPNAAQNKQELVLLPIDPHHIHAYWNLSNSLPNTLKTNDTKDQLTLRFYSNANFDMTSTETKPWFDLSIDNLHSQQHVFLSHHTQENKYSAAIGHRDQDNQFTVFAVSNTAHVPIEAITPEPSKDYEMTEPEKLNALSDEPLLWKKSASGQTKNQ
jgi:hypothetical protein